MSKKSSRLNRYGSDWRAGSGYPDVEKSKGVTWAWEFLRRSSEYQTDWKRFGQEEWGEQQPSGLMQNLARLNKYHLAKWLDPFEDKVLWNVCPTFSPRRRTEIFSQAVEESLTKLETLLNACAPLGYEQALAPVFENQLLVLLDLRVPVSETMDVIKREVINRRKQTGLHDSKGYSKRKDLLLLYVRILDAEEEAASRDDILRVLYPSTKRHNHHAGRKYEENRATALELASWKYLLLLGEKN